jgi:hypothetical protein
MFSYIHYNCFKVCMYVRCRNLLMALFSRQVPRPKEVYHTLGPAEPMRRTKKLTCII